MTPRVFCLWTLMYAHTYTTRALARAHARSDMHTHTDARARAGTHARTHTHTHTHTRRWVAWHIYYNHKLVVIAAGPRMISSKKSQTVLAASGAGEKV